MADIIKARNLRAEVRKHGAQEFSRRFQEALDQKKIDAEEFSVREAAKALIPNGDEFVERCNPQSRGGFDSLALVEAGEINTTLFTNITGQIIYNRLLAAFESEFFHMSRIVPNVPTAFNGEKIAGLEGIGDKAMTVPEGMPFPEAQFGEDYIVTPATTKRGLIVSLTKETIFFDRTGQMLQNASTVGEALGLNKEKRLLSLLIGATNNHNWRGTAYDTYQTSTPWINKIASNDLVDWTDFDAVEQLFANMLDPNTGEPILMRARDVMVCPARAQAANRVLNATEIRYTASSAPTETIATNPLRGSYNAPIANRLLYARLTAAVADGGLALSASNAAKYWFVGDFARAFNYMQNWPLTVVRAPTNADAEFKKDIVARFKASERGVGAVIQPRAVVMSYDS